MATNCYFVLKNQTCLYACNILTYLKNEHQLKNKTWHNYTLKFNDLVLPLLVLSQCKTTLAYEHVTTTRVLLSSGCIKTSYFLLSLESLSPLKEGLNCRLLNPEAGSLPMSYIASPGIFLIFWFFVKIQLIARIIILSIRCITLFM